MSNFLENIGGGVATLPCIPLVHELNRTGNHFLLAASAMVNPNALYLHLLFERIDGLPT